VLFSLVAGNRQYQPRCASAIGVHMQANATSVPTPRPRSQSSAWSCRRICYDCSCRTKNLQYWGKLAHDLCNSVSHFQLQRHCKHLPHVSCSEQYGLKIRLRPGSVPHVMEAIVRIKTRLPYARCHQPVRCRVAEQFGPEMIRTACRTYFILPIPSIFSLIPASRFSFDSQR
jgi:hypothetical protein